MGRICVVVGSAWLYDATAARTGQNGLICIVSPENVGEWNPVRLPCWPRHSCVSYASCVVLSVTFPVQPWLNLNSQILPLPFREPIWGCSDVDWVNIMTSKSCCFLHTWEGFAWGSMTWGRYPQIFGWFTVRLITPTNQYTMTRPRGVPQRAQVSKVWVWNHFNSASWSWNFAPRLNLSVYQISFCIMLRSMMAFLNCALHALLLWKLWKMTSCLAWDI